MQKIKIKYFYTNIFIYSRNNVKQRIFLSIYFMTH